MQSIKEIELFLEQIKDNGTCWEWQSSLNKDGYGLITIAVHKLSYVMAKGKVPKGHVIDHLCRNRKCCNPEHLEAVTPKINAVRGNSGLHMKLRTHCPKGHELKEPNLEKYGLKKGKRCCKKCKNQWNYNHRKTPEGRRKFNEGQRLRRIRRK